MNTYYKVIPSSLTVKANDTFTVDISIVPDTTLKTAGAQFDFKFNPACLAAQSVTEGNIFKSKFQTFFMPGTIDNTAGTIKSVASTILSAGNYINTEGILATITFKALNVSVINSGFVLSNLVVGQLVPPPQEVAEEPLGASQVTQINVSVNFSGIVIGVKSQKPAINVPVNIEITGSNTGSISTYTHADGKYSVSYANLTGSYKAKATAPATDYYLSAVSNEVSFNL